MFGIDDAIQSVFEFGSNVIDKIWPDADDKEKRKLTQFLALMDANLKQVLGQLDINKTEAQHKSVFVAGWRPAIGWICGAGIAYSFVLYPLLTWAWSFMVGWGWLPVGTPYPPELSMGTLVTLLTGMLGIGGLRTFDKMKKTETNSVGG